MAISKWRPRPSSSHETAIEPTALPELSLSKQQQIKRATRTRKTWALLTSFSLFLTTLFLLLVHLGGIRNQAAAIHNWYFIRLDLSNIVPASVPNFALINTIAQTLGLHDFYQVGLWGYCEGYNGQGVTFCSEPRALYWFNPVEILRDQLLAGASINLPANVNNILHLIQLASQTMFGFFLTGTLLSFLLLFLMPLSLYTRWLALPLAVLVFLNALLITAASTIATVMFTIFRNTIGGVAELNIGAEIGVTLFAFMWVAAAFAIFACLVQVGLCCCCCCGCASRRDVEKGGKRPRSEKADPLGGGESGGVRENPMLVGRQGLSSSRMKYLFWKRG